MFSFVVRKSMFLRSKAVGFFVCTGVLALPACQEKAEEPRTEPALPQKHAEPSSERAAAKRSQEPAEEPKKSPHQEADNPYKVPERTQQEVEQGLLAACEEGHRRGRPLLIEFSAPWCGDCRALSILKEEAVLAEELSKIAYFPINIGRFDRHEQILDDFAIRAIANWQIVATTDCSGSPKDWKRIAHRTLEPKTGRKKVSASELAEWLRERSFAKAP